MTGDSFLERNRARLAGLAWIGFVLAAAIHTAAVAGLNLIGGMGGVAFGMHSAIFPLFGAAIFALKAEDGDSPPREARRRLLRRLPIPWRFVFVAIFYYALATFGWFMFHSGGGNPEASGHGYQLVNHGQLVRELTRDEYEALSAWQVRAFSGYWMIFYLVPALVFSTRPPGSEHRMKPNVSAESARERPDQ